MIHDAEEKRHQAKCALGEDKNRFSVGTVDHRAADG
jgi:hypothetical protein